MRLTLTPDTVTSKSVISRLEVDGAFECYVLEPPNPIPAGIYQVAILDSVKFGRPMPHLLAVPGHNAIEIHWGNTAKDTKDCLIVGQTKAVDFVGHSHEAFDALFPKLEAGAPVSIDVQRQSSTQPVKGVTMQWAQQQLENWFNSPRGHAVGMLLFQVLATTFPQYAQALQTVSYAFGYGAVVAGAASQKP